MRDYLLGHTAKDTDIEVYGVDENILKMHFSHIAVGKSFGIFKIGVALNSEKHYFDIALPGTENKLGRANKGLLLALERLSRLFGALQIDEVSGSLLL